jgi:hypothetical protein
MTATADGVVPLAQCSHALQARDRLDDALELARWQRIEREFASLRDST